MNEIYETYEATEKAIHEYWQKRALEQIKEMKESGKI